MDFNKKVQPLELFRPFTRHNNLPIDMTSVFTSLTDAQKYAADGTVAYPGQIITVIYNIELKIRLYVIVFNNDNSGGKYKLEPLATGLIENGLNDGIAHGFNYIGIYQSTNDLPSTSTSGDLAFVIDTKSYHAYTSNKGWQELELFATYASTSSDGIIKADEYSTLINKTESPALYFNDNSEILNNPSSNKWVKIAKQADEDIKTIEIPTVNNVIELIDIKSDINRPLLTVESISETNVFSTPDNSGSAKIAPRFKITYDKKSGGSLSNVSIYRQEPYGTKVIIAYINNKDFNMNNGILTYEFSDDITNKDDAYLLDIGNELKYYIEVNYGKNINYNAGKLSVEVVYRAHNYIEYKIFGNMSDTQYVSADVDSFSIEIPKQNTSSNKIYAVQFNVPQNKEVKRITFSNQPHIDFLDVFDIETVNGRTKYSFVLEDIAGFDTDCEFEIVF